MKLAVGDIVVHRTLGAGRIVARDAKTVVVELVCDGLRVTLLIAHADQQLRPALNKSEIDRVRQTLREPGASSTELWMKRRRDMQAKLGDGDPVALAEIVRDGAARIRALAAGSNKAQMPSGEKALYLRARRLLSQEIHVAHHAPEGEADGWIEAHLQRG